MRTSSAKAKGRRLSARLREKILETFPELTEQDIFVTSSGETGVDLKLSEFALSKFPFAIECKNQEKLNIWACLKQAESNSSENQKPLLVFSRNRSEDYVSMKLDDFLKIIN